MTTKKSFITLTNEEVYIVGDFETTSTFK